MACSHFLRLYACDNVPINRRSPINNPDNVAIVAKPTINVFIVIPSGLYPKEADIAIPKQYKQYLMKSHIISYLLKVINNRSVCSSD